MSWKFDDLRFGVEAFIGDRIPAGIVSFVYKASFIEFPLEPGLSRLRTDEAKCRLTQMSCTAR